MALLSFVFKADQVVGYKDYYHEFYKTINRLFFLKEKGWFIFPDYYKTSCVSNKNHEMYEDTATWEMIHTLPEGAVIVKDLNNV